MRHRSLLIIVILLSITFLSCQKDSSGKKGCTNKQAANYDSTATIEDGSCKVLDSQYDGRFQMKATISNMMAFHVEIVTFVATLARMSPINNIITLSNFNNRTNYTASFIVNQGSIIFPKQQFTDPGLYIYSATDGTFYGTPFLDPVITLRGDTLSLIYEYQSSTSGDSIFYASVTGLRIP